MNSDQDQYHDKYYIVDLKNLNEGLALIPLVMRAQTAAVGLQSWSRKHSVGIISKPHYV